jgi:hypothetical protein
VQYSRSAGLDLTLPGRVLRPGPYARRGNPFSRRRILRRRAPESDPRRTAQSPQSADAALKQISGLHDRILQTRSPHSPARRRLLTSQRPPATPVDRRADLSLAARLRGRDLRRPHPRRTASKTSHPHELLGPARPLPRGSETKPGAMPGSTALARARTGGDLHRCHEAFWAETRKKSRETPKAPGNLSMSCCYTGRWLMPT